MGNNKMIALQGNKIVFLRIYFRESLFTLYKDICKDIWNYAIVLQLITEKHKGRHPMLWKLLVYLMSDLQN